MTRKPGEVMKLAAMIFDEAAPEVQLNIRRLEIRARLEEPTALGEVRGQRSAPIVCVIHGRREEPREIRELVEVGMLGNEVEHEVWMVVKVLANAGQIVDDRDPMLVQCRCRTDPRDLE